MTHCPEDEGPGLLCGHLAGPSRVLVLWPRSSLQRAPRQGRSPRVLFFPLCQAGWASVTCGPSQDRHLLPRVPAPLCLSPAAPMERRVEWVRIVRRPVPWLRAREEAQHTSAHTFAGHTGVPNGG